MNLPNILSLLRIGLSPLFILAYFGEGWFGIPAAVSWIVLWILFALIEISDLLDGYLARRFSMETDIGKLLDPFADSLSRLTYFSCFVITGVMPVWVFVLVLYRDLGVAFVRQVLSMRGTTMASRMTGKLKAWAYALAGIAGLIVSTYGGEPVAGSMFSWAVYGLFSICGLIALWSFFDYAKSLKAVRR